MVDTAQAKQPQAKHLKDYQASDYLVESVDLHFDLTEDLVTVRTRLSLTRRIPAVGIGTLRLDGSPDMVLNSLALNGEPLGEWDYSIDADSLTIHKVPGAFTLDIETQLRPQDNTSLMGLYKSGGNFCTQCEAEGFRRITYFLDRPDVMSTYTTTIVADAQRYPVLLSNGNFVESGQLANNRHWAKWHDPFPKPAYLFALVAGDLARYSDEYTTRSGRRVQLHMYVQHHNRDKCGHAMESLKKAMRWDEEVYGREYDLNVYMIVAVDDFNMGAMENKGLNIFNSKYVLANPQTATDTDYQNILGVIGHEYFHNWSGNRVTLRDWFQLSLKEGFTVFRDQQFAADMTSAVKRIQDVNILRTHQFREDAGPMAHPVRPDSYVEINNFYTVTVYNKGAEVVRMLYHLLGPQNFRRGTDLYFRRHDGQAVTCDDFVRALEDANNVDLSQFRLWYSQAGTPELKVRRNYNAETRQYTLHMEQLCPSTPGQPKKAPFHIPLAMGLLDKFGREMPLQLEGEPQPAGTSRVLAVRNHQQTFTFVNVPEEPVPSLLRGFSAPVKLNCDWSDDELAFLTGHDPDPFSRWDAGQQLALKVILSMIAQLRAGSDMVVPHKFVEAFRHTLANDALDKAFIAKALCIPSEAYVAEFIDVVDPDAIHEAFRHLRENLAGNLKDAFLEVYESNLDEGPYSVDAASVGRRSLKNVCLGYLMELHHPSVRQRALHQFHHADNMTDVIAAVTCFANSDYEERREALEGFYERWKDDPLVVDKWFTIQATSRREDTLETVKALTRHSAFNHRNPNKVRALVGAFCHGNAVRFHDRSGAGYRFAADWVLTLDPINPQVAARLVSAFTLWRRYDEQRKHLMKAELERIAAEPRLSRDVFEVVSKSLAG